MPKKNEKSETATETKVENANVEETVTDAGGAQAAPQATATEPAPESDTVEVSKADLQMFMKRLQDLEADNKKLLKVADKGRMFEFTEAERVANAKIPTVKLTRIGSAAGPLVIAWKMTKNESYVDGNRLIEHQEIEVFYHDGKTEKMPLLEFYRNQNKDTVVKVIARTVNSDGSEILKCEMKDGTLVEVGLKFVN